jgi:hypothetical protein
VRRRPCGTGLFSGCSAGGFRHGDGGAGKWPAPRLNREDTPLGERRRPVETLAISDGSFSLGDLATSALSISADRSLDTGPPSEPSPIEKDRWNRLPAVPYGALDGDDDLAEMGPAGEVRVGVARPLEREDAVDDGGQRRVTAAFIATNISSDPT